MFAVKKVMSQTELEMNLKHKNTMRNTGNMNGPIVIVEKTRKNSDKIFQLFMENKDVLLKKLRSAIGKTSLYRLFLRIEEIDAIIKTSYPSLYFLERRYQRKNSKMLITYCLHPNCQIGESDSFFFLEFKPAPSERIEEFQPGIEP